MSGTPKTDRAIRLARELMDLLRREVCLPSTPGGVVRERRRQASRELDAAEQAAIAAWESGEEPIPAREIHRIMAQWDQAEAAIRSAWGSQ